MRGLHCTRSSPRRTLPQVYLSASWPSLNGALPSRLPKRCGDPSPPVDMACGPLTSPKSTTTRGLRDLVQ